MKKIFSGYINRTIYLIVLMALLPALLIIVFSGLEHRKFSMDKVRQSALNAVHRIGNEKHLLVENARMLLTTLAHEPSVRNLNTDTVNEILASIQSSNNLYSKIMLTNANGKVLADSRSRHVGADFSSAKFIFEALRTKQFTVGEIRFDFSKNIPTMFCSYPLLRYDREVRAILSVGIPMIKFTQNDLPEIAKSEVGNLVTADRDGTLPYGFSAFGLKEGQRLSAPLWGWINNESEDSGLRYVYNETTNTNFIVAYSKLRESKSGKHYMTVLLAIPEQRAYAAATKDLLHNILLLGVTGILALGISWFIGKIFLGNHINSLMNVSSRISDGDFDVRVEAESSDSDLGRLAGSLNRMADALKERNKELLLAKSQADEANKAKSNLLVNISHELRTPMNSIIGLSFLAIKSNQDKKQESYLKKINTAGNELLGIIDGVLDFSKIETGRMKIEDELFNLNELIISVANAARLKASEKDLRFNLETVGELPSQVRGSPLRVRQILNNLLNNAVKFTEQGHIDLICRMEGLHGGRLRLGLEVKDSGIGMNEEQLEKMFSPFAKADSSTARHINGAGLGLSIVKSLVEMMAGEIKAISAPGVGTDFNLHIFLSLPAKNSNDIEDADSRNHLKAWNLQYTQPLELQTEHDKKAASEQNTLETNDNNGFEVLLTEDNLINQQVAVEMLQGEGYSLTVANNGKEALDILRANPPGRFKAVLMDLQMPVMDGYEAATKIRELPQFNRLPIIALTAHALPEERQRCLDLGMNDHVSKPINLHTLLSSLRFWINNTSPSAPAAGTPTADNPSEPTKNLAEASASPFDIVPDEAAPTAATEEDSGTAALIEQGFAVKEALNRLGGNQQLYNKILESFVKNQANTPDELRQAVQTGNYKTAERLAHTIKGLSASLGENRLAEICTQLEDDFHNTIDQSNLDRICVRTEALALILERVIQNLNILGYGG